MQMRYLKIKPRQKTFALLTILLLMCLLLAGCDREAREEKSPVNSGYSRPAQSGENANQSSKAVPGEQMKVHFLDVGQADCVVVQLPGGETLMVDAGNRDDSSFIVGYLNDLGVRRIDYLVATHPHEDHIGGMADIVESFQVGQVYMPRVTTNTWSFEHLLQAIRERGLKIKSARAGLTLLDRDDLKVRFTGPALDSFADLNQASAVLHIRYGDTAFLLAGDADKESEAAMLRSGADLSADVLKVGHHGSHDATSSAFLETVNPDYAVISVGAGNDYGHPHQETLNKLKQFGVQVLRTDLMGTIVFTSDGRTLKCEPGGTAFNSAGLTEDQRSVQKNEKRTEAYYIGNKRSKKFHRPDCPVLPVPQNRVIFKSREDAVASGYEPCGRCKP